MLAYRMVFRNLPRHILYRSLASDGPGSKKPPNLTSTKSENRMTNIKDRVASLLLPKKGNSEKIPKLSEISSKDSIVAALKDSNQPQNSRTTPKVASSSLGKLPADPKNTSSLLAKTSDPPKDCASKEGNPTAKNASKPDDKKTPSKPAETKNPPKPQDIKSPCLFPTKFDDPKPSPCKPEDEKPKRPASEPPKTNDTKLKCPPKEPPKAGESGQTSCKSNTTESCPLPQGPLEKCETKDEKPTCLMYPIDCVSEDITKICPPRENPATKSSSCKIEEQMPAFDQGQQPCPPQGIICESPDLKSCIPPIIEKNTQSGHKAKEGACSLETKASPPKEVCPPKGPIRNAGDGETAKQSKGPPRATAADSCKTQDETSATFPVDAATKKDSCENVKICPPPATPTPPRVCRNIPEITRLEYLSDPCDTDPEELLLPKDEVLNRRCFKCSTVQENAWVDLSATTGVPEEQLKDRTVTISKAFKNVMQQGTDNTKDWEVQWDTKERWQNPLMGWASSADPLGNVKLSFATQLDAERWCTRNGWKYQVLPEREPAPIPPKSYASNFSWNRRYRVSTK